MFGRGSTTRLGASPIGTRTFPASNNRSEEHTSELQSQSNLVCRLLLEKKKTTSSHTVLCSMASSNCSNPMGRLSFAPTTRAPPDSPSRLPCSAVGCVAKQATLYHGGP